MARILLSAYACEPGRGSEPGIGWNWATESARLGHQVTVITRANNRPAIEREAEARPANLDFLYYDLPRWVQRWRQYPGGKPLHYFLWQWFAVRQVRRRFPNLPFDLVQHVTFGSARYHTFMGSLGIRFIFGPVSGGEGVPLLLRPGFSAVQRWGERLRDISNCLVPLDPLVCRSYAKAASILVTPDTLALVPRRWRHKCSMRLAVGLSQSYLAQTNPNPKRSAHDLRLLYVGRLLDWKGVHIALRAIHEVRRWHPEVRFTIVGEGPSGAKLAKLSRTLGLGNLVRWMGSLPQSAVEQHYSDADVLLFPSLRDSGGFVVLEALAHSVPVLCTDLGGPGFMVNSTCGRALPTAGRNPEQLAHDFAEVLRQIITTPTLLDSLSAGARARARQLSFQDLVLSVHPMSPIEIAREA